MEFPVFQPDRTQYVQLKITCSILKVKCDDHFSQGSELKKYDPIDTLLANTWMALYATLEWPHIYNALAVWSTLKEQQLLLHGIMAVTLQ